MIFDSFSKDLVAVFITIATLVVFFYKWSFKHWERKGAPFLEPKFPFGNMENPFARTTPFGILMKKYYDEFKARGCKHGGLFNFMTPVYLPVDPEYIKNVMQKDFQHFVDRGVYYNEKKDPMSAHLFNLGGHKWRTLRTKLTPTFTSGKMKMMFDILVQCSKQMLEAVDKSCEQKQAIDIKDVAARFTTDVIGSCAFGLDFNSFKNPDAEFRAHGRKIFAAQSKFFAISHIFGTAKPKLANFLGITLTPKDTRKFFFDVVEETLHFRKENNVVRQDMLQLLIEMKEGKGDKNKDKTLTLEEIVAQAFVFFAAGFETSSTTTSFCLYELAIHQDIQERVRNEINKVLAKHDEKFTYESLNEMKYLGQVIDETLRKYPALPFVTRRCVEDYKVRDTDITVDKGTFVFIPILALHRDPDYFPDPEKFDPERFSEENRKNIVPFTYLPFGEGPRICIGLRFGVMQTKIGLASLLKNFKFTLNSKTKNPLEINPYNFTIFTSKDDILLNTEKI